MLMLLPSYRCMETVQRGKTDQNGSGPDDAHTRTEMLFLKTIVNMIPNSMKGIQPPAITRSLDACSDDERE